MFGSKKQPVIDTTSIDTIIGADCTICGDINAPHSIKIEGRVQGNISSQGQVVLGDSGLVTGDIHSAEAVVFGTLQGNIRTHRLHLRETARIHGNMQIATLQVDPGALYEGAISMQTDALTPPAALPPPEGAGD